MWLSGALVACALIGTCLALLRSDILPFNGAWPSSRSDTRTPATELATVPAVQPGPGRVSSPTQPVGGPLASPTAAVPLLPGAVPGAGTLPATIGGPLAGTPTAPTPAPIATPTPPAAGAASPLG
jgi:hypothetical protein